MTRTLVAHGRTGADPDTLLLKFVPNLPQERSYFLLSCPRQNLSLAPRWTAARRKSPLQKARTVNPAAKVRETPTPIRLKTGRMGEIYQPSRPDGPGKKLGRKFLAAMASRMMLGSVEMGLPPLTFPASSASTASPHGCDRLLSRSRSWNLLSASPPCSVVNPAALRRLSPASICASPDNTTFLRAQSERPKIPLLDSRAAWKVRPSITLPLDALHPPPHCSSCNHLSSISRDASTRCWVGASKMPSFLTTSSLQHGTASSESHHREGKCHREGKRRIPSHGHRVLRRPPRVAYHGDVRRHLAPRRRIPHHGRSMSHIAMQCRIVHHASSASSPTS